MFPEGSPCSETPRVCLDHPWEPGFHPNLTAAFRARGKLRVWRLEPPGPLGPRAGVEELCRLLEVAPGRAGPVVRCLCGRRLE